MKEGKVVIRVTEELRQNMNILPELVQQELTLTYGYDDDEINAVFEDPTFLESIAENQRKLLKSPKQKTVVVRWERLGTRDWRNKEVE